MFFKDDVLKIKHMKPIKSAKKKKNCVAPGQKIPMQFVLSGLINMARLKCNMNHLVYSKQVTHHHYPEIINIKFLICLLLIFCESSISLSKSQPGKLEVLDYKEIFPFMKHPCPSIGFGFSIMGRLAFLYKATRWLTHWM